jgi:hypothetical protein
VDVVEELLITIGVMGLLFLTTVVVGAVMIGRAVRRRYRVARERLRGFRVSPADVGSPTWWAAQNRRHTMWRAVSSAEHSVGLARQAQVAVGDLPVLTAQLRTAANGVDAVLRASARSGSLRDEDRADCDRIAVAGAEIHAAALASLRAASRADTEPIVSAVRIEVAALAAGVRAAHHW